MTNTPSDPGYGAEQTLDDRVTTGPDGEANPGEYEPLDEGAGLSADTGVTYDSRGEPESTPHDAETDAEAEDEAALDAGPSVSNEQ
jgi:hypothetical protein